ncbi:MULTISPECIES: excalibur calcium-binding domain-containing protein [Sphingomonas]|uniref:excalibur calcium-binding domain-containing protein n=1 Tax=Sphingomonas TaxID=13687 RepID=UPI00196541C5|nr:MULTISPECIES: excalibur calcium-binding domain-containing protein [Sphingomonas]
MRTFAILIIAIACGIAVGAGMSWLGHGNLHAALPKLVHGKGPHMVLDRPPSDAPDREGSWRGGTFAEVSGVRVTRGSRMAVAAAAEPLAKGVYYRGCREAEAAGAAPLHRGDPGYREDMDGDGDGIACEDYGNTLPPH